MTDGAAVRTPKRAKVIGAPGVDLTLPPFSLFWFNAANFGDALSPFVVSHVAGRPVTHANPERAQLFALGSLMGWLHDRYSEAPASGHRPLLWGTGCLKPPSRKFLKHVDVRAVRGPISNTLLNELPRLPWGDPGIFADELFATPPARTDRIGVIAHHKLADDPALAALAAAVPQVEVIDVRTFDAMGVVERIASCRYVLSSSLHGLVVADAFGVPNRWLDPRGNHGFSELKFYDYATGIGRDLGLPVALADAADHLRGPLPETIPYADGIAASKHALRLSFPAELRGFGA